MRICDACHVRIRGSMEHCPLCGAKLRGEKEADVFPKPQMYDHMYRKIMRVFLFLSVIAVMVCLAANRVLMPDLFWSMFVLAGVASFWLSLYAAWKKKRNIPKGILWEMTVVSILAVAWDMATGWHGWSVDFILPILCTVSIGMMVVMAKFLRLQLRDYIIYILMEIIYGLVVWMLLLTHVITFIYPALICVVCCGAALAALVIFHWELFREELQKRLHF